jgi:ubiquinone/menaquinone biosynthesis C-methylase UbiE
MNKKNKTLHYKLTKDYFRKSVTVKRGYYIDKSLDEVKCDIQKRTMWKIYVLVLKKLLQNDSNIINLLDAGCGMGNFTLELANHNKFKNIVGIDFLIETINLALENKKQFEKITFLQGDLVKMPFCEKSFDVTFCLNVLHHIHKEDFNNVLRELARVTDKFLVIEIRNANYIFNFLYEFLIPLFYRGLPLYSHTIKDINKLINRHFELNNIEGNFSKSMFCRRLVLTYRRIQ